MKVLGKFAGTLIGTLGALWLLLHAGGVVAATCTSVTNGDWNQTSTWDCGIVPGAADDVIIDSVNDVTVTVTAPAACNNLTIDDPTAANSLNLLDVGGQTLTVNGSATISGGSGTRDAELRIGTGTVTIAGDLNVDNSSAIVAFTGSGTLNLGGNFSNNAATFTPGTGTVNYNGTGAQTVGAYTYNNLSVNKTAGTATLSGNVTVNGDLTVGTSGGTLDLGTFTANRASAGGTISVVNGASLLIGGANTFPTGYTTRTLEPTSTVDYNGTNQVVTTDGLSYGHLVLSGSGTKTPAAGTTTIAGDFTLAAAVTYAGATNNPTVNLAGNFSNSGTFNSGAGVFTFNGTATQSLTGATTFANITLDNGNGLTLNNNVTVTNTLTMNGGKITTGANRVIIGTTGSIANVSAARYVVGTVEKQYPASPTNPAAFNFPIGDPTDYTPVLVDFTNLTSAGSVAASTPTVPSDHPQIGTATLDAALSVNRYWTLAGSGGIAGTYEATFNYVTGDKDGASNPPDFVSQYYDNGTAPGGTWFDTTRIGGVGNSIQLGGLMAFGDFAVAEPGGQQANHFVIGHAGTGVTCAGVTVTFTAHKSNHNVEDTISGLATITSRNAGGIQRGSWSLVTGSGTFVNTGGADGGEATYNFVDADDGVVVLSLNYSYEEIVNINIDLGGTTEHSGTANNGSEPVFTDPQLTMVGSGFILTSGATVNTQIAAKPSDVNPDMQSLSIQAVRTDDDTGACASVFADGTDVDIQMASECINPSACHMNDPEVTITTLVDSGDIENYNAGNVPPVPAALTPVTFRFGPSSAAPFSLSYPDVGIIKLHFRRAIPPANANFMEGGTNNFAVRPFALYLTAEDMAANPNPAAADETGDKFTEAGEDFTVNVSAVGWESADDSSPVDGIADGHDDDGDPTNNADLSGNIVLPSFGQESPAAGVLLGAELEQPLPGTDPGLAGGTTVTGFSNGAGSTTTARYGEVGIIEVDGALTTMDYLGIGAAETAEILGRSGRVGRFSPHHFAVSLDNAPEFAPACNAAFTYMDQPFDYDTAPEVTITAENKQNIKTENYDGVWWKLADFTETYTHDGTPLTGAVTLDDAVAGHIPIDCSAGTCDGAFTTTFTGPFTYARDTTEIGPVTSLVDISFDIDEPTDMVSYAGNPFVIDDIDFTGGDSAQRWGRMTVLNATGSELLPVTVPLMTQYFDGTTYVISTDDGCTALVLADDVDLSNPGTGGGTPQNGDGVMNVGGGTSQVTSGDPVFSSGQAGLVFSSPGAGNTGFIDIEIDLTAAGLEHLYYDWDGDGDFDNNPAASGHPTGRVTFGIFSGSPELIYMREPW